MYTTIGDAIMNNEGPSSKGSWCWLEKVETELALRWSSPDPPTPREVVLAACSKPFSRKLCFLLTIMSKVCWHYDWDWSIPIAMPTWMIGYLPPTDCKAKNPILLLKCTIFSINTIPTTLLDPYQKVLQANFQSSKLL